MSRRFCVTLCWLLASAASARGPPSQEALLQRAKQQIHDLDSVGALRTLERVHSLSRLPAHDLAQIYLYRGLAHAELAEADSALAAFHSALLLDPSLELAEDVSPRVMDWWVKAGGKPKVPAEPRETPAPEAPGLVPFAEAASRPPPTPVLRSPIQAAPPAVTALHAVPPPELGLHHSTRWLALGLGAAGVAVAGAGLGFGVHASSVYADARADPALRSAQAKQAQAVAAAQTANILFATAGGLAVGGAISLFF